VKPCDRSTGASFRRGVLAVAREIPRKDLQQSQRQRTARNKTSSKESLNKRAPISEISAAAWEEIEPLKFSSSRCAQKRSDKTFPLRSMIWKLPSAEISRQALAAGRNPRLNLNSPDVTCHIEIMKRSALVYAAENSRSRRMPCEPPRGA